MDGKALKFKFLLNLKILSLLLLMFTDTSFAQGCNFNDVHCIRCPGYQICGAGLPENSISTCENSKKCTDAEVVHCRMKLGCYTFTSPDECTQVGIFPDSTTDSKYYVCLNGPNGFLKYDFDCPPGQVFDESQLTCAPKTTDTPSTDSSTSTTTLSTLSTTPSTPSTTPSTPSTTPSTPSTTPSTPSTTPSTPSTTPSTPSTTPSTPSTTPSTPSTTPSTPSTTPSTPSTTPSTPSTTPSTPSTTPSTPSTPSTTPVPFVCERSGIFPDPNNCKMYYRCSISLRKFHYVCPSTSYFNENILKCSLILTPLCQEQISKNATKVSLY